MRNPDPTKRSTSGIPRLYQKYVGHDNNRDFYLNAMPESDQHEPDDVPGVVSPDHVQSPPDRPCRGGALRATVPRSAQPQSRPAPGQRDHPGRSRDAQPAGGRGEGRRRDAGRGQLPDLVERRSPDRGLFPQPDRDSDRDDREPDPDGGSVRALPTAEHRGSPLPDRAPALALPPVGRVLDHQQPGDSRSGLPLPGDPALQHLSDGPELDRARRQGQLDQHPAGNRRRHRGGRPRLDGPVGREPRGAVRAQAGSAVGQ